MINLGKEIVFWGLALVMVATALRMVTTRNVVHAALYLVGTLLGAAAIFILLLAEFVAWAQVLVYVGAIVVLMLFGLMLTRAPIGGSSFDNDQRPLAALVSLAVFGITSWILVDAFEGQSIDLAKTEGVTTERVGEAIFTEFVWPFEVVSILLLAALIGAVVLARRDPEAGADG